VRKILDTTCPRTVRKWVDRYEREGLAGLQDRSSRPRRLHHPTPQSVIERIEGLRRQRLTGQAIAAARRDSPPSTALTIRLRRSKKEVAPFMLASSVPALSLNHTSSPRGIPLPIPSSWNSL
jgi:hypothetical protein